MVMMTGGVGGGGVDSRAGGGVPLVNHDYETLSV